MAATFEVDSVKLVTDKLPAVSALELWKIRAETVPEACSEGTFVKNPLNPFVAAIRTAWNHHMPLVLSPDAVWLTIAQGLATHVNENAETLRHHFVEHEGKKEIHIFRGPDFTKGRPDNDWPSVFGDFSAEIHKSIGKKHDLIVSSFTTTGPVEKAASEIVLMDAMKAYFEYHFHTLCGFPRITLTGTKDDWENIVLRTMTLSEFGLGWWTASLVPVLEEFVKIFDGQVDRVFWRSCYNEGGGSGGPHVSGWVNAFFPYIGHGMALRKNTILTHQTRLKASDWTGSSWSGPNPDSFPTGLAVAPFTWHHIGEVFLMDFVGGLIGVAQHEDGSVEPKAGWAIRDRKDEPHEPSRLKEREEGEAERAAKLRAAVAKLPKRTAGSVRGWTFEELPGEFIHEPSRVETPADPTWKQFMYGVDPTLAIPADHFQLEQRIYDSVRTMDPEVLKERLARSRAEHDAEMTVRAIKTREREELELDWSQDPPSVAEQGQIQYEVTGPEYMGEMGVRVELFPEPYHNETPSRFDPFAHVRAALERHYPPRGWKMESITGVVEVDPNPEGSVVILGEVG